MARRSYLSRIAQPLTSADRALWSTPRASPDEARPMVQGGATRTPVAPISATQMHPTARARRSAGDEVAPRPPGSAGPHPGFAGAEAPAGSDETDVGEQPAPLSGTTIRPASVDLEAAPGADVGEPSAVAGPGAKSVRASGDRPRPETTEVERPASLFGGNPRDAEEIDPPAVERLSVIPEGPPTRAAGREPRLHIGAIEIRMIQPPPAPAPAPAPPIVAAPTAPSTPLARAYAWRFGLAQS